MFELMKKSRDDFRYLLGLLLLDLFLFCLVMAIGRKMQAVSLSDETVGFIRIVILRPPLILFLALDLFYIGGAIAHCRHVPRIDTALRVACILAQACVVLQLYYRVTSPVVLVNVAIVSAVAAFVLLLMAELAARR